jgi:hypothetical protein
VTETEDSEGLVEEKGTATVSGAAGSNKHSRGIGILPFGFMGVVVVVLMLIVVAVFEYKKRGRSKDIS